MKNENGYATLIAIILLAILGVVGGSAVLVSRVGASRITILEKEAQMESELLDGLDEVLEALASDLTPAIDGPSDPVWKLQIRGLSGGLTLQLQDLSSAVNLNASTASVLKADGIRMRFSSVNSYDEIKSRLIEDGPIRSLPEAEDLFSDPERASLFFTVYGFWNPAISDITSLTAMIRARSAGTLDAEALAARLVAASASSDVSRQDFIGILGDDPYDIAALLSVEPQINVHFVDRDLLAAILDLEFGGKELPEPRRSLDSILAGRMTGEITQVDLRKKIEREEGQDAVLDLLGTRTWFWSVIIESEDLQLDAVIARNPVPVEDESKRFLVLERRFSELQE